MQFVKDMVEEAQRKDDWLDVIEKYVDGFWGGLLDDWNDGNVPREWTDEEIDEILEKLGYHSDDEKGKAIRLIRRLNMLRNIKGVMTRLRNMVLQLLLAQGGDAKLMFRYNDVVVVDGWDNGRFGGLEAALKDLPPIPKGLLSQIKFLKWAFDKLVLDDKFAWDVHDMLLKLDDEGWESVWADLQDKGIEDVKKRIKDLAPGPWSGMLEKDKKQIFRWRTGVWKWDGSRCEYIIEGCPRYYVYTDYWRHVHGATILDECNVEWRGKPYIANKDDGGNETWAVRTYQFGPLDRQGEALLVTKTFDENRNLVDLKVTVRRVTLLEYQMGGAKLRYPVIQSDGGVLFLPDRGVSESHLPY